MASITATEIVGATGGRIICGDPNAIFSGVSIDSRTIKSNELFVPLKGQRFDGHDFLLDALRGGSGALVSTPPVEPPRGRTLILVKNTLRALQDLARAVRLKSGIKVVGITGTNGKTTTKEIAAAILGIRNKVLKTSGNLNNHIGLPLSLLRVEPDDAFGILEMGASIQGDIRDLCAIALPEYGVITNVGMGHLEGFGDLATVRGTKLELFEAVRVLAVNGDDAFLMEGVRERLRNVNGRTVIPFGIFNREGVFADEIELGEKDSRFRVVFADGRSIHLRLPVPGRFNIYNALAAAAIAGALGAGPEEIRQGIESFAGVPMRLELREFSGATVISDVYNANPLSMEEAVKELVRLRKKRAIAVLGDMLELGSYAEEAHRKLGRWMAGLPVDIFVAVGPLMASAAEEFRGCRGRAITAPDSAAARNVLCGLWAEGDTVLVKGSRGMRMERVLKPGPGEEDGSAV